MEPKRAAVARPGPGEYAPFYETYISKVKGNDILGHVSDAERIFAYRALRIARGDQTPLSAFEQDDYVRGGNFAERTLANLAEEFGLVRAASIALFKSLQKEAW